MRVNNFFKKYKDNIEILEIIGKGYYYSCENFNKVTFDNNRLTIDNLSITLEENSQIKEEMNNEQKMYIYLYKDFALKFTMKKIMKLVELLKYRKSDIQKIEVIGDNFYYPCTENSNIIFKEESGPVMLSLGKFILTLEKEEFYREILEQCENIYLYEGKNFQLKIVTNKVSKPLKVVNPWENLKNILKL